MPTANDHLREFRAPSKVEWTLHLRASEPVMASLTMVEDGQVDERDATTVPSITRTWAGKLYVDVCPLERRTWVLSVKAATNTAASDWKPWTPIEGLKVRVDAGDVLYANLREGGVSTVGVERQ